MPPIPPVPFICREASNLIVPELERSPALLPDSFLKGHLGLATIWAYDETSKVREGRKGEAG